MKKNRISFLTTNYLPNVGGLVSYIKGFSQECVGNTEITVYCSDGGNSNLLKEESISDVTVKRERLSKFRFFIFSPLSLFLLAFLQILKNKKLLESNDAIIIRHFYYAAAATFFSSINSKSVFIAPLIAEKLFILNNKNEKSFLKRTYNKISLSLIKKIERRAFKKSRHISVLSTSKKIEIEEFYGIKKVTVNQPGFDKTRFKISEVESKQLSSDFELFLNQEIRNNKKIVLTVCRLVEEKNIKVLMKALAKSRDFSLVVVGDGPLLEELKAEALKSSIQVFFAGFQTRVESYYQVSDVFVLPSTYEGFGHVYLEALACGCPCIGLKSDFPTIITATEEIVEHGVNGAIVEKNDPESFLNAIQLVIESNLNREVISKTTAQNFSWTNHRDRVLSEVYDVK